MEKDYYPEIFPPLPYDTEEKVEIVNYLFQLLNDTHFFDKLNDNYIFGHKADIFFQKILINNSSIDTYSINNFYNFTLYFLYIKRFYLK